MKNNLNEKGRSMIEMLGVLAIIGVLSVGGIAGYSKAMTKYRINKTIEQITLIAGNVRTFFAPQRNYSGLDHTILKKAKLVPDEMWDGDYIKNVWGGAFNGGSNDKAQKNDKQAFYFYTYLPKDNVEACIELMTHDWSVAGVKAIASTSYVRKIPIDIEDAIADCSDTGNTQIQLYFQFDSDEKCLSLDNIYGQECL